MKLQTDPKVVARLALISQSKRSNKIQAILNGLADAAIQNV